MFQDAFATTTSIIFCNNDCRNSQKEPLKGSVVSLGDSFIVQGFLFPESIPSTALFWRLKRHKHPIKPGIYLVTVPKTNEDKCAGQLMGRK